MSNYFEEVLKKMGWVDGFQIPVANRENKALEDKVAALLLKKVNATVKLENVTSKYDALEKHLKNVTNESEEHQKLLTAHKQQIQTEDSRFRITRSYKENVEHEVKTLKKKIGEVLDRQEAKRNDLGRAIAKLDKLKTEMTWDAEAIKAWEESLKKRDDDNERLKQFTKEDEKKLHELETKRKNCQTEVIERKKVFDRMVTEIIGYEQLMERSGRTYKEIAGQRETLINHWKDAVRNLKQRDDAINDLSNQIIVSTELLHKKQTKLEEQNEFLKNEKNNNKEIEMQINDANAVHSKLRRQLDETTKAILVLHNEIAAFKRTVVTTANSLENERSTARDLDNKLRKKEDLLRQLENDIAALTEQSVMIRKSKETAADQARRLEHYMSEQERIEKILHGDIAKMQGVWYRTQQGLAAQKDITKSREVEISSTEMSLNLLHKHERNVFNELQKQNEIIYEMDYRMSQMESKLSKLDGHTPDVDFYELNEKIKALEKTMTELNDIRTVLQTQITKLADEMRKMSSTIAMDDEQLAILKNKLQDQLLRFEKGRKHTNLAKQRTQEKQVEENLLRLRVSQIQKARDKEDKNIYNLQKMRLELEAAMKERQIEINTNKDILIVKRRNLEEEKGRLKRDLMGRYIRIEQFQKKYYLALMGLGKDDDGQPFSVTHYKIKNAQEKFFLQKEGDELDQKIRKAENEIVAMENTLKMVNSTNVIYRQSLIPLQEDDKEIQEMKDLEGYFQEKIVEQRKIRKHIENKKAEIKELRQELKYAQTKKEQLLVVCVEYQNDVTHFNEMEEDNQKKLAKLNTNLGYLKTKLNKSPREKYNQNIGIEYFKRVNKEVLYELTNLIQDYPDMAPTIRCLVRENNVDLPSPRTSISNASSGSSIVSMSTIRSSVNVSVTNVVFEFDQPGKDKCHKKDKNGKHAKF